MQYLLGLIILLYCFSAVLALKAKKFETLPSDLIFILVWASIFIKDLLPPQYAIVFPYFMVPVLIIASSLTTSYYYKRKMKFQFWLFLILSIVFAIPLLLTVIGVMPR